MKKFIEVHKEPNGKAHLINVSHIVEVVGNIIYTDDFLPCATDFPHLACQETYEEIKKLIEGAVTEWR